MFLVKNTFLSFAFCTAVILPLNVQAQTEKLDFTIQNNSDVLTWKIGSSYEDKGQYKIIELIREGDDIKNWKELVTVQNFVPPIEAKTPEEFYRKIKSLSDTDCPKLFTWKVIANDRNSILYERQAKPCKNYTNEHEIVKVIYGKSNIFRISYSVKTYQMSAKQREEWMRKLSQAKIVR
jgi:hypothetical protein